MTGEELYNKIHIAGLTLLPSYTNLLIKFGIPWDSQSNIVKTVFQSVACDLSFKYSVDGKILYEIYSNIHFNKYHATATGFFIDYNQQTRLIDSRDLIANDVAEELDRNWKIKENLAPRVSISVACYTHVFRNSKLRVRILERKDDKLRFMTEAGSESDWCSEEEFNQAVETI